MAATAAKREFGDFQTPDALANQCCGLLRHLGVAPLAVIEPTCGVGNFLGAALGEFPGIREAVGFDVNPEYVRQAANRLQNAEDHATVSIEERNIFDISWPEIVGALAQPLLILGNPPWVTNSALAAIGGGNLPEKTNFQGRNGLDAITGKSNFDISEWMLIKLIEALSGRDAHLAMLCKTGVARKALMHAWQREIVVGQARLFGVDASRHFDAAVDACFLVVQFSPSQEAHHSCLVFDSLLPSARQTQEFGYSGGTLVADLTRFDRTKSLAGGGASYRWRSGVKHDCSRVMEFKGEPGGQLHNGLGMEVTLEPEYLFPMLKSSHLASEKDLVDDRWMLVTQRSPSEDTATIEQAAPRTWNYLQANAEQLDNRGSSIYTKRPRFAVFGIGEYSFAPWKVAISGFYKHLHFRVVGPRDGKPTVLDDTCYFLPCGTLCEAEMLARILNSEDAQDFYSARIFWDNKRPITADILNQLNLDALVSEEAAVG